VADSRERLAKFLVVANFVTRPLLRSRLHPLLSGQLMVLSYTGGRSGHSYSFPIGYFDWDAGEVISFSSRKWPFGLAGARDLELQIRGTSQPARPDVTRDPKEKSDLLREFAERKGPRTARRLMLGLPGDRPPTQQELDDAATKTTIVRFRFSDGSRP